MLLQLGRTDEAAAHWRSYLQIRHARALGRRSAAASRRDRRSSVRLMVEGPPADARHHDHGVQEEHRQHLPDRPPGVPVVLFKLLDLLLGERPPLARRRRIIMLRGRRREGTPTSIQLLKSRKQRPQKDCGSEIGSCRAKPPASRFHVQKRGQPIVARVRVAGVLAEGFAVFDADFFAAGGRPAFAVVPCIRRCRAACGASCADFRGRRAFFAWSRTSPSRRR